MLWHAGAIYSVIVTLIMHYIIESLFVAVLVDKFEHVPGLDLASVIKCLIWPRALLDNCWRLARACVVDVVEEELNQGVVLRVVEMTPSQVEEKVRSGMIAPICVVV